MHTNSCRASFFPHVDEVALPLALHISATADEQRKDMTLRELSTFLSIPIVVVRGIPQK